MIKKIISMDSLYVSPGLYECFKMTGFSFLEEHVSLFSYFPDRVSGFYMWFMLAMAFFIILNFKNVIEIQYKPTTGRAVTATILLVWSILSLSGISTFLYFNF